MYQVIFVRNPKRHQSLADLAAYVFSLLSLSETEERESSNYVEGHYFVGYASNASIKIFHSDGAELEPYPYWIVLDSRTVRKGAQQVLSEDPEYIAKALANGGLEAFIPSDGWSKVGWVPSGTVYSA